MSRAFARRLTASARCNLEQESDMSGKEAGLAGIDEAATSLLHFII
jgi:hypothetical protein